MALGLPYEQVFQAAPLAAREGLTPRQLQSVATKVGARLLSRYVIDLHGDTGILGLEFEEGAGHWVVLRQGTLIDPSDGTLWDADDYLTHYRAEWDCFFEVHAAVQHGPRRRRNQTRLR